MVDRRTHMSDHFIHAGAGTGLVLVNLGAMIPGLFPALALGAVVTVVLLVPLVILGLVAAAAATPFYVAVLVGRRARERWRRAHQPPTLLSALMPAQAGTEFARSPTECHGDRRADEPAAEERRRGRELANGGRRISQSGDDGVV
jgi:hypothetical protein